MKFENVKLPYDGIDAAAVKTNYELVGEAIELIQSAAVAATNTPKQPFLRVVGEDGTFYARCLNRDLVAVAAEYVAGFYEVSTVDKTDIPPCRYADFTDDYPRYADRAWKGGTDFYID